MRARRSGRDSLGLGELRSWGGEPVDGRELVGSPDAEDDQEDEAGEIDGAAAAQAGVAADEDHGEVGEPHGEGEQDLGIEEVAGADGLLGDQEPMSRPAVMQGRPKRRLLRAIWSAVSSGGRKVRLGAFALRRRS